MDRMKLVLTRGHDRAWTADMWFEWRDAEGKKQGSEVWSGIFPDTDADTVQQLGYDLLSSVLEDLGQERLL